MRGFVTGGSGHLGTALLPDLLAVEALGDALAGSGKPFVSTSGTAAYVGDGADRWPAGHTLDAARLYRLALEGAPAGSRLHAVDDEGVPLRRITETIGRHLDVPVADIEADAAADHFGALGLVVMLDNPTSSAVTQELLDWHPTEPGLLDDLDAGHYFAPAAGR